MIQINGLKDILKISSAPNKLPFNTLLIWTKINQPSEKTIKEPLYLFLFAHMRKWMDKIDFVSVLATSSIEFKQGMDLF